MMNPQMDRVDAQFNRNRETSGATMINRPERSINWPTD